jgi:hypothetical protein
MYFKVFSKILMFPKKHAAICIIWNGNTLTLTEVNVKSEDSVKWPDSNSCIIFNLCPPPQPFHIKLCIKFNDDVLVGLGTVWTGW